MGLPDWSGPAFDGFDRPYDDAGLDGGPYWERPFTDRPDCESPLEGDDEDWTYSFADVPWYDGGTHVYVHDDELYAIVQENPLRWTFIQARLWT